MEIVSKKNRNLSQSLENRQNEDLIITKPKKRQLIRQTCRDLDEKVTDRSSSESGQDWEEFGESTGSSGPGENKKWQSSLIEDSAQIQSGCRTTKKPKLVRQNVRDIDLLLP